MSKGTVPDMAFDASSSDDDAPEEVSVSSSRQQGISQLKDIKESLKKSREEDRERKRLRNEMFRIQKEQKLKDLSKRKLPEDVLEAISAKSAKKLHKNEGSVPSKKIITRSDEDDDGKDEDSEGEESDAGDDDISDSGVEGSVKGYDAAGDFIPLRGDSGLALVTPGALAKTAETAAQKALSFKQGRLYNRIPRENAQQRRAKVAKRKAAKEMK